MRKILSQIIFVHFLFFILILSGCGGSGAPGAGGKPTDFVALTAFSLTPTSVSDGQSITLNATTAFDAPSQIYTFEFHLTSDTSSLSNTTKIFGLNCGTNPQPCAETIDVVCDRDDAIGGFPKFSCSLTGTIIDTKTISNTGNLFAVGQSCIFNANLTQVCDSKTISVIIP